MPTPGYVFRDSGTTPPAETEDQTARRRLTLGDQAQLKPSPLSGQLTRPPPQDKTTDSHALALADHDIKGAAQIAGQTGDVTDLGWRADAKEIDTLVGGLPNEELWTLIRRFNRQMYHVKSIPRVPPNGLDLEIADQDEFSPDKLRANIERLYMTVIIGLMGFGNHIARLRSWREPRRTAPFCAVYFLAWLLGCLVPLSCALLLVLILVPQSRPMLFPPAPIALVNSKTGGVQKPKAGVLGSHDSATGAPEKHKGEAVEQEASNLVNGIAHVAISSAAGRHDQGDPGDTKAEDHLPDPTKMAVGAADSKASAQGQSVVKHDKTKQPMEDAIWTKMRPAMHVVGDIADVWERFANALSPTPPFPHTHQYRFAGLVAPLFLISFFVKPAHVVHGTSFVFGLAFFTDPLLQRGIKLLNQKIPDWPKYIELRNTLLIRVPTNAQLTLTLLRIGEANRAPLPPPPRSDEPPPDHPAELDKHALTNSGLDASHSEIDDVITVDAPPPASTTTSDTPSKPASTKKKGGIGAKILSFFQYTTAGVVESKMGVDHVRAMAGSGHAKQRLGILPPKDELKKSETEGPVEFKGRYNGKKGAIYLDSSVSPAAADGSFPARPCVYFTTQLDGDEEITSGKKRPGWAVSIADITELKKVGGLGWKGKLVVGWATEREIKDGLEIVTKDGARWRVTAMKEREELFNRLVAVGGQIWESY
ncbi:hypothetical protein EPUS_05932 [Endocarpon pusillum Z07020]|uniref:Uncharacterized protein n=1 Tax=Endocarpon pusillum (strain Z07020 / HMAS-L-300199) TaxID=1263415 RepID=U1FWZ6_ENDPU|nr:uncharacterized protein EPUS_05932 [Endocarpon pusillum Z07020]ERF69387.1 hypothetical protein EPUS_05932 [Endocarpon pusillum Z07020]